MTNTKFDSRAEMLSLSLSNIGAGLVNGIPVTAALARTAVNLIIIYC